MISGIGLSKYRNEDICNELTFSKEGMRLQSDAKREEEDALMKEANEVLAQTETVLKHRKDALYAKHIEGRESLHELDYIFESKRTDFRSNWLDQVAQEQEEEAKTAVNLNIESSSARTSGVVEAARARAQEIERRESPQSEEYPSDEELQKIEDLKAERQKMLELIKNNQKAKMEDMRKDTKSKLDSFKREKTES